MDPLTHTLLGGALSRCARRPLARIETATLLIGANLPDLDAITYFASADAAFGFRRGWTHGLAACVVWAPILAGVMRGVAAAARGRVRAAPFGRLLRLAAIAVATHPLLDWLNTYGVRLLAPFSDRWFYGDALFIIDPWVWMLLGGGCWIARPAAGPAGALGWSLLALAAGTIVITSDGVPPAAKAVWIAGVAACLLLGRRVGTRAPSAARAAVALAAAYAAVMIAASAAASTGIPARAAAGGIGPITDMMVGPTPADPFTWDVVVETPEAYHHGTWRWLSSPRLVFAPVPVPRPGDAPLVREAIASPVVRGTMRWMRFPFVEVDREGDDAIVRIMDLRYVRARRTGFGVAVVRMPDRDGHTGSGGADQPP